MKCLYVLYDQECSLCVSCGRWLMRQAAFIQLRFIPLQSPEIYGGTTLMTIIAFGVLTLALHHEFMSDDRGAVALAIFIAMFWISRIVVDFTYFKHADWPQGRQFCRRSLFPDRSLCGAGWHLLDGCDLELAEMKIPILEGVIKRRMLINFRIDPEAMQKFLPSPFRPKLHANFAIAGVCLIRLEHIRPKGFPAFLGFSSENAAHRIAVKWDDTSGQSQEGVFIPRRDTGSLLNHLTGGRVFSGEHHLARFHIIEEGDRIDFSMKSCDEDVAVRVQGRESNALSAESCFASLDESSAFFECGSLGYSSTRNSYRLDGLRLKTLDWQVRALEVKKVESSFFSDATYFPAGSAVFDHALIMRNIRHEWHQAADLFTKETP